MVQQFTSEGNWRSLVRQASPMGEKQRTTPTLLLHRSMKNAKSCVSVPSGALPSSRAAARTVSQMATLSSGGKRLGISPEFSRLFTSSTKPSSLICVSLKRKTVLSQLPPALVSIFLMSSRKAAMS